MSRFGLLKGKTIMDKNNETRELKYAKKLSALLQVETISQMAPVQDLPKFRNFHHVLRDMFPNLFQICEFEDFDGSILLRWPSASSLEPIMFMNHHDVVEAGGQWEHDPFGGCIENGRVHGRGAIDTKGGLFAMLQAAEELAAEGFVPSRDIYFESSCTEETTGLGADTISKTLQERGLRFYMILDEGGMILYDPIGGADGTFAMIGVGEKGCADLKFVAHSNGGHASTPGKDTPLVRLGAFMKACDNSSIFQVEMSDTIKEMFARMAPTMKGATGFLLGHSNIFSPILKKVLPSISPTAGALLKTTLAFTMAQGSDGTNVLPQEAWVIGNMRFSHHQGGPRSIEAVKQLAKKYDIEVEVLDEGFQSPLAHFDKEPFKLVEEAVKHCFPNVLTAPYIMTGASDARYFSRVCDECLRFVPFVIDDQQLSAIHGLNESVDISTLAPAVDCYRYIMTHV